MNKILCLAVAATVLTAPVAWGQDANPVVVMETNMGVIKIELYPKKAPITVKNFLDYMAAKHYDGTIFHRVIPGFMIQGGGFTSEMKEKPGKAPIKNESFNGLANEKYTIAMARTSEPDSATCEFFINVKDNNFLDKAKAKDEVGYCVFGKVIAGMDVVDKIKAVKTGTKNVQIDGMLVPFEDVPEQAVVIKSVTLQK